MAARGSWGRLLAHMSDAAKRNAPFSTDPGANGDTTDRGMLRALGAEREREVIPITNVPEEPAGPSTEPGIGPTPTPRGGATTDPAARLPMRSGWNPRQIRWFQALLVVVVLATAVALWFGWRAANAPAPGGPEATTQSTPPGTATATESAAPTFVTPTATSVSSAVPSGTGKNPNVVPLATTATSKPSAGPSATPTASSAPAPSGSHDPLSHVLEGL